MRKQSLSFLRSMLSSPSPSGYEEPVQRLWRSWCEPFAQVHTDPHGNAIGVVNPDGKPRVMFAGHCDELGFLIRYIDDKGYLYFGPIGGFDETIIPGRRVTIHTSKGPVNGVIGKTPVHLIKSDDRKKGSEINDLWIDIGAKNHKDAASVITIGDPATYQYDFLELKNDMVAARGFDDRIGSFIVAEVLRTVSGVSDLTASVHCVSTVQEEIGLRGSRTSAYGIDPLVGIAVDVTFATDQPGVDPKQVGDIKLGGGPVIARGPNINPHVFSLLVETARRLDIPYQVEGISRATGTDANSIQVNRAGVAAGLVSIPLRYMHTPVEMLHMTDVERTIKLLAGFASSITDGMTFIP